MIPAQVRLVLVLLALAAAFGTGWTVNGWRIDRAAQQARADGERMARAEEQRRQQAQQEVQREAQRAIDRANLDRRAADVAHGRMLDAAYAAARSGPPSDPAASTPGQTAGPGCTVLADVLGESDQEAGGLALALDLSRAAGTLCQQSYDALTPP